MSPHWSSEREASRSEGAGHGVRTGVVAELIRRQTTGTPKRTRGAGRPAGAVVVGPHRPRLRHPARAPDRGRPPHREQGCPAPSSRPKGSSRSTSGRKSEVRALDGLDLTVAEGSVLGLLGPNGAGKTTTVRILATLLKPDAGHATVAGFDVVRQAHELRSVIGLSGQYAAVDENLTGRENLVMFGRLYQLPKRRGRSGRTSYSSSST